MSKDKKTLIITGTHDIKDTLLDLTLPFKSPEWSERYKKALKMYKENSGTIENIVSHSLGASIATYINNNHQKLLKKNGVKVFTFNAPIDTTISKTPVHKNQYDYRTTSDLISVMDSKAKKTPFNPNLYKSHFTYKDNY